MIMKLVDVCKKILMENALGLPEPSSPRQASRQDMLDALEHMDAYGNANFDLNNFSLSNKMMSMDEILYFDDISSWGQWGEGELAEMDDEERKDEIEAFRGSAWAKRAYEWMRTGNWPAIVIVDLKDGYAAIGDGRGRVSLAYGLGMEKLPVSFLLQK